MLRANYTPRFQKDVKRLKKKHVALDPLKEVVELVVADTPDSRSELGFAGIICIGSKASGREAWNAMSQTLATGCLFGRRPTIRRTFREPVATTICSVDRKCFRIVQSTRQYCFSELTQTLFSHFSEPELTSCSHFSELGTLAS